MHVIIMLLWLCWAYDVTSNGQTPAAKADLDYLPGQGQHDSHQAGHSAQYLMLCFIGCSPVLGCYHNITASGNGWRQQQCCWRAVQ
jgi:hypothetical protein